MVLKTDKFDKSKKIRQKLAKCEFSAFLQKSFFLLLSLIVWEEEKFEWEKKRGKTEDLKLKNWEWRELKRFR